jgi:hypothetical protein
VQEDVRPEVVVVVLEVADVLPMAEHVVVAVIALPNQLVDAMQIKIIEKV